VPPTTEAKPGARSPLARKDAAAVKEAIATLTDRWSQHESVTATVTTLLPTAFGGEGVTRGKGSYSYRKKGKREFGIRHYTENNVVVEEEEGRKLVTKERIWFVTDGKLIHSLIQEHEQLVPEHGGFVAKKWRYSPQGMILIGGRDLFKDLRDNYRLALLPDETVEGHEVYVIEATPREQNWRAVHYFDKQTGVRVKFVEFDNGNEAAFTFTLSDIKLNPEIDEGLFKLELPEGLEYEDLTDEGR